MPLTHALRLYAILFAVALFGLLIVVALAMLNRWPFMSGSARLIGRLAISAPRVAGALPLIHSVEKKLFDFHRYTPGGVLGQPGSQSGVSWDGRVRGLSHSLADGIQNWDSSALLYLKP